MTRGEASLAFLSDAEIGQELFGYPETLRALGLGVLRDEKNVHAGSIVLQMPTDREGGDAPPAYEPGAEQGQQKSIAILEFALLVAADRNGKRFVHQFDPEVKGTPARYKAVEAVLRLGARGKAPLECGKPLPITLRSD
jgi:hypothetical protein